MFKLLTHLKDSVEGFSVAGLNLDDVLSSPYTYAQRFVKTIGTDRQTRDEFSITDVLEIDDQCGVKVEGYETHSRMFYDACTQVLDSWITWVRSLAIYSNHRKVRAVFPNTLTLIWSSFIC